MTFLEQLKNHKGGLVRLKTQLYWYEHDRRGYDHNPGRVCLVLDVDQAGGRCDAAATFNVTCITYNAEEAVALLLIDGSSQWIWVTGCDLEIINDPD